MALAVTLTATAFNANAKDGDIPAGHPFAREACKVCHMVEAEEGSSRIIAIGPLECQRLGAVLSRALTPESRCARARPGSIG
jgi:cytochrome c2